MSVYDNSPEAFERYQRKQAAIASWVNQAPTHYSINSRGSQTPAQPISTHEHLGHGTPLGSLGRSPSSLGYPPQATSNHSKFSSQSHSRRDIRQEERAFSMNSPGYHNSITTPVFSSFVHQPPSTTGSVSTSRTKSSRPGTERSRTMDYAPSHVPSPAYLPSPNLSQYAVVPAASNTSGVMAPRVDIHRSLSSTTSYPVVNEWPSQNQYPPGFVHGPSVASSISSARSGSTSSSSASFVHPVGVIPHQGGLPQAFSDTSCRPTTTRTTSSDQRRAYPTSNPVTAMSYAPSEARCGRSATSGYAQSTVSISSKGGNRHMRSRSLSASSRSSDETIGAAEPQTLRQHPRVVEPDASNAWLTSQVSGDLVPLVARATQLATQERQRQQLGIPSSQRSVDPNCPFKQVTLDPGASINVDGCLVVNQGFIRQTYWVYSQDDLRASLGLPRVEVADERRARKTDKERRRRRERSRSKKGSRY